MTDRNLSGRGDRRPEASRTAVRPSGFTLAEVLVSLFILAVGIMGVAAMQLNAQRHNAFVAVQTVALSVAEQRMELLRSAPSCAPNELADGTGTDTNCQQSVTYQNSVLTVDCSYVSECRGACPADSQGNPAEDNYIEFTVSVTTPTGSNPVQLVGGKEIECPS